MEGDGRTETLAGQQKKKSISSHHPHDAPPATKEEEEEEELAVGGATAVFQSRLQTKRLERMQQRQRSHPEHTLQDSGKPVVQPTTTTEEQQQSSTTIVTRPRSLSKSGVVGTAATTTNTTTPRPHSSYSHHHHHPYQHQSDTATELTTESDTHQQRRMMRGEARRTVMNFGRAVWDALRVPSNDNLELLRCFFVVEGAPKLLSRRSPDLADGGRSLLHLASWLGDEPVVRFLIDVGAEVDAIDTVPSRTTPLLEASRAGHRSICVLLLQSGANATHRDSHGDTAFHWAARCGHGTLLLEMALELEKIEGQGSLAAMWTTKNLKGKTVLEYVKANTLVMPLLQKRLGVKFPSNVSSEKRKSRSPFTTAAVRTSTRGLLLNASARSITSTPATVQEENAGLLDSPRAVDVSPPSREQILLTGVQTLGLDVASFTYKPRDELASSLCSHLQAVLNLHPTAQTTQSTSADLKPMEGFILAVSPNDKSAKKVWQTVFLKLDDISAKLVAFTDRSQYCVQWSLPLVGADIATPIPGEPNHGVNVDDTPFCFYVRNSTGSSNKALARTSAGGDECHYLAAPSDEVKKQWMKLLLKNAKDGPRTPRFANMQAENEFSFQARVVKFRTHDGGKHAEYLITCSCQLFSKMAARRLAKQWDVWHRFSEFDMLNEALKVSLGPQLLGIDFVKHRRDALRSLFGSALEHNFLEERRLLLDTYITRVCDLNSPVEFFKHHADPNLKKFFCFDDHCQNVVSPTLMKYMLHLAASHSLECFAGIFRLQQDESPRKAPKGSRTKEQKTPRKSDKSERDEDSSHQSVSSSRATSDTNSQADFRYSESNSVGPAQKDSSAPKKHHHHEHSVKTKTEDGKSSDKRERQASKKKEKKNHLKGDALSPREDTDILRSASPTGAH